MLDSCDTDLTLPPIVASRLGKYRDEELFLTIAFHPDTARIGQRTVVPVTRGSKPWILGRRSPAFSCLDVQAPAPLDDPHISRRALQFDYRAGQLSIRRFDGSSRCRLGGSELYDTSELDREQLRRGVPLLLGHSVVLMLRLGKRLQGQGDGCASLLRGSSACMADVRAQISQAASSDLDVLIRGETGTGKELVATAIHSASGRQGAPMISINMAAIPAELAPAALFGSARGAFTGADRAASGYFEQAEGGSLFMDEIGDASPAVQPQLLRALQQREIQAVGGAIRRVDVRVISATDATLDGAENGFKAALRHRLGACEICLPALREHPEDVGELLLYFLQQSAVAEGRSGLLPGPHSSAFDIAAWAGIFYSCVMYQWPGNVRELLNVARQVVLASTGSPTMSAELRDSLDGGCAISSPAPDATAWRRIQEVGAEEFDQAMACCDYEPQRVAKALGVSRSAVYRRIDALSEYRLVSHIPVEELQALLREYDGNSAAAATHLRVPLHTLQNRLRKLSCDWR